MRRGGLPVAEVIAIAVATVAVIATPFVGTPFWIYNLTFVSLYAIPVVGLNLLLGYAGQVSFAQTTFMAIGGYASAILTTRTHVNPWLALLAGVCVSIAVALVIGVPLLRLRGHYLGMATFALALGTTSFATAAAPLTNGGIGLDGVPPLAIGGLSLSDPTAFYFFCWGVCAAATIIVYFLARSYIGRAFRAIATRQETASSLGIRINRLKLLALVLAGVMAAIAGSLYAEFTTFVGPDLYDVGVIINLFIMLFVGGRASTIGPVVGAAVVVLIPQLITGLERYQNLAFLVLLLFLILLRPAGLFGRLRDSASLASVLPVWLQRRLGSPP